MVWTFFFPKFTATTWRFKFNDLQIDGCACFFWVWLGWLNQPTTLSIVELVPFLPWKNLGFLGEEFVGKVDQQMCRVHSARASFQGGWKLLVFTLNWWRRWKRKDEHDEDEDEDDDDDDDDDDDEGDADNDNDGDDNDDKAEDQNDNDDNTDDAWELPKKVPSIFRANPSPSPSISIRTCCQTHQYIQRDMAHDRMRSRSCFLTTLPPYQGCFKSKG